MKSKMIRAAYVVVLVVAGLLLYQNCGQNGVLNSEVAVPKNSGTADQTVSACSQRQTDDFSDSTGTNVFNLSRPTSLASSVFVTVNGLISKDFTYNAETVSVQVNDYSDLVSQSQAPNPVPVSITYCNN
jgi:hypothetical protein